MQSYHERRLDGQMIGRTRTQSSESSRFVLHAREAGDFCSNRLTSGLLSGSSHLCWHSEDQSCGDDFEVADL